MTGRSAGNTLTKTTAILAATFFATSLALSILAGQHGASPSILGPAGRAGRLGSASGPDRSGTRCPGDARRAASPAVEITDGATSP